MFRMVFVFLAGELFSLYGFFAAVTTTTSTFDAEDDAPR